MAATAKNAASLAVLLFAVLAVQQLAAVAVAADIQCPDVLNDMDPCLNYLQAKDDNPSTECCAGVTTLAGDADTQAERRATCECLKSAYYQFNGVLSRAQALPSECGISLPYPISPDVDCSTDSLNELYQIPYRQTTTATTLCWNGLLE
ncbi:hypothetical protein ACP4OV_013007 [Aristida adscensionis]